MLKIITALLVNTVTASGMWEAVDIIPTTKVNGIKIFNNLLYVADGESGLRIIDIKSPENMKEITTLLLPTNDLNDVLLGDAPSEIIYVVGRSSFHRIDVTDSIRPIIVSETSIPGNSNRGEIKGGYAFIADLLNGLHIINLSDMSIINTVALPNVTLAVTVLGDYAYVSNQFMGVIVIDVSDVMSAFIVGNYHPNGITNFCTCSEDSLFVLTSDSIHVLDVTSNPTSPVFLTSISVTDATRLTIEGTRGYLADSKGGMRIIENINNPIGIILSDSLSSTWMVSEVQLYDGVAFIANSLGGIIAAREAPAYPTVSSDGDIWPSVFLGQQQFVRGTKFNLLQFPNFTSISANRIAIHMSEEYPISGILTLECGHSAGCDFLISIFICSDCDESPGGMPELLILDGWRLAECSPSFQLSEKVLPMNSFYKHLPRGNTSYQTESVDYITAMAVNGFITQSNSSWCPP